MTPGRQVSTDDYAKHGSAPEEPPSTALPATIWPTTARPTGFDVARLAGVSQATVSLVFSGAVAGNRRVSESTQARVRQAAESLGYLPNVLGRQLRLRRSGLILFAVPNICAPFFARAMAGMHDAAEERGLTIVLTSNWTSGALSRTMATNQLDGLIMCSPIDSQVGQFPTGIPVVFLDADPALAGEHRSVIQLDLDGGVRAAVEHLTDQGHRRLGRLRYLRDAFTFRERQRAFVAAAAASGLEVVEEQLAATAEQEDRTAAAWRLLARPDYPHAIVCDDDLAAVGVYHAAATLGLRVPDDVSVVGIDNIDAAAMLSPGLTTVDLRGEELGQRGISTMSTMLRGEPVPPSTAPTQLIIRSSTRPA